MKMNVEVVLEARSRMRAGRAAGGGECVVQEMILLLPIDAIYVIVDYFEERLQGWGDWGKPETWKVIELLNVLHSTEGLHC